MSDQATIHDDGRINVRVIDDPGAGGAHHVYDIGTHNEDPDEPNAVSCAIRFQCGPIDEHGVNGITNESLLAIVAHRLECQAGEFACTENDNALTCVRAAIEDLEARTAKRKAQGVEGTSQQHT